jgi:hypothetical protein
MNEHLRDTEFLRHCLRYHDAPERYRLEERLTQVHRNERCVGRAAWLMVLLTALATTGLGYATIFVARLPQRESPFVIRFLCELGVASLICLTAFLGLRMFYRRELERHLEECRRLAAQILEARLGPSGGASSHPPAKEPPAETFNQSR